jgi:hypothetical protein
VKFSHSGIVLQKNIEGHRFHPYPYGFRQKPKKERRQGIYGQKQIYPEAAQTARPFCSGFLVQLQDEKPKPPGQTL